MSDSHDEHSPRIYCAGPLFNQAERDEMTAIADCLCDAGYRVYLPHRDGMEFRLVLNVLVERGWPQATAGEFLHAAIFALDVYQLVAECRAVVWNLNGRTPDEGAVSEAAMAWSLGKPIVAYCDDARSLISGRLNPLLMGLVDFQSADKVRSLPELVAQALERAPAAVSAEQHPPRMRRAVRDGSRLWDALQVNAAGLYDERIADIVTELFAPAPAAKTPT